MNDDWIFDSMIQYIRSPYYYSPVLTYIDENCTIFDDEEENKFEYTDVHKVCWSSALYPAKDCRDDCSQQSLSICMLPLVVQKFKMLIENLLLDHLENLGITSEQFAAACKNAANHPLADTVFDQMIAVDDFLSMQQGHAHLRIKIANTHSTQVSKR
jgi:hypothetical protein